MSEIRATTISDSAGTGPITLTAQSAAKVWCKLDSDSVPAGFHASFGTSSLSDNSAGNFTINYTNNFNNEHYSAVGSNKRIGTTDEILNPYAPLAGSLRFDFLDDGTSSDPEFIFWTFHGDLA